MQKQTKWILAIALAATLVSIGAVAGYILSNPDPCKGVTTPVGPSVSRSTPVRGAEPSARLGATDPSVASVRAGSAPSGGIIINVVAAENFWGSLVTQLGGSHVNVTSIITDPNTDPHEYQSNDSDAKAIAHAAYVIVNNVGYDSWATQIIDADHVAGQVVLNVGDSLGVRVTGGIVTGNPHLWYNPTYVNQTVLWMYDNLTAIQPTLEPFFTSQYDNLTASLDSLYSEVGHLRHHFAGSIVASTESIFVYLANATGLDLVSPPAFMEAVAEGNDPPDQSVVTFECQLKSGHVGVLVFNAQTVTAITTSMKEIAQANNVSVMSVTETIVPPTATFQSWMGGQLDALYVALDAKYLGD
ncbi:MAG: zinc ABC transporter substrate-binding protein [Thermoplasmata archaeon]